MVFPIQDLLGMSGALRRPRPQDEQINDPANPRHYWRYRMHISLEDLIEHEGFNHVLHGMIKASGRDTGRASAGSESMEG